MATREAGRHHWWWAGLSLFVAAAVGVAFWCSERTTTYHAPLAGSPPPSASPARAAALLDALERAVRGHHAAAAARLGSSPVARRDLAGVARNAGPLHVRGFSLRYVDQAGGVSPSGDWTADVRAEWRFGGFDRRPESLEVAVGFATSGGRLRIAHIGGGGRRTPLWLAGPVHVRRTPTSLVLVDGPATEADRMARLARRAVPQVREVLPDWRGGLVVEVPRTSGGLRRALRATPQEYADIAAVTTTVNGSHARSAPVHVFVNPQVFLPLRPRGAQVVLTHEATHVATGGATSRAPIWLVEGFADYVALHAQSLPVSTTAARITALVRHQGAPAHLPGAQEFATGAPHLEARYESAWLACRLVARTGGQAALVGLYRSVDRGTSVDAALRARLGFGLSVLTHRWRELLTRLPR